MPNVRPTCSTIWRYMDLDKFCHLITNSKLYFASPKDFEDPWELSPPKKWLSSLFWEKAIANMNPMLPKKDVKRMAQHGTVQISDYYNYRESFGFSCWHGSDSESENMWRLYCKTKNSIAIKSSISRLLASFPKEQRIYIAPVEYVDFNSEEPKFFSHTIYSRDSYTGQIKPVQSENKAMPFLLKRKDFEHEKELRVVIWDWNHQNLDRLVDVKLDVLLESIHISPFADPWFKDSIIRILNKFTTISTERIFSSSLYEPPVIEPSDQYRNGISLFEKVNKEEQYYVEFSTMDEFDKWHEGVKKEMFIPFFGRNALTGDLSVDSCGTLEWVTPHPHATSQRVAAIVTKSIAPENSPALSREDLRRMGYRV